VAKVTMPQLGESVAEGTIGRWLKQPGDAVARYEPLLEVITDKVNAEVPSPYAGILQEILAPEGAVVPNNAEIAIIDTGDDAAESKAGTGTETEAGGSKSDRGATTQNAPSVNGSSLASMSAGTPAPAAAAPRNMVEATPTRAPAEDLGDPNARMTPAVRRLLREHGLQAAHVVGTGGGGRITREDVFAYVEAQRTGSLAPAAPGSPAATTASSPTAASAPAGGRAAIAFPAGSDEVLVPMSQMRKGIAAQMTRALQAPHAYIQMEVDVSALVALRDRLRGAYQAKEGIGLSFVPFVVKACTEALKRNPTFNAHWTDQGLVAKRRINMGVAVAVDEGLIVPVVRDADQLSLHGLNAAIADLATRARSNKLRLDDFGGGTFTVDNTGYLGTNLVMPIINVPEVSIVTMEAITKRAVVVSTPEGDMLAIRPVMNMVLGIDHRANDGAAGAALLRDIKTWLEGVGPETAIY
jgi:2-oxoisovalerate dehydrogenase E2 component (dihydrolipoyl transacylase)